MNLQELTGDYTGMVERWCPPNFDHEPIQIRAVRAMLNLRACVLDQQRALRGQAPIRPLESYPVEPEKGEPTDRPALNLTAISADERSELGLALLLLKDFRSDGKYDPNITLQLLKLAHRLGLQADMERWMSKLPPTKVVPR